MEFTSQICTTKKQSEQLLALGLKKETADMILFKSPNLPQYPFDYTFNHDTSILADVRYVPMVKGETPFIQDGNIPAWSLHRLIEMIPIVIEYNGNEYDLILKHTCIYEYSNESKGIIVNIGNSNIYESTIILIEWLIKEGYFNKEYLEERV